jgi:hypothetical protein
MTDEEIEAANTKYWTSGIVRLSSGRYAIFDPFSNEDGMPLRAIGTLAEIEQFIPDARDVYEYARQQNAAKDESPRDLLISLGLIQPIKRRA